MHFTATFSRFPSGELAEVFLNNGKISSQVDVAARDSAVVASVALQYGVPPDVLRGALLRDQHGAAAGPLCTALDLIAEGR